MPSLIDIIEIISIVYAVIITLTGIISKNKEKIIAGIILLVIFIVIAKLNAAGSMIIIFPFAAFSLGTNSENKKMTIIGIIGLFILLALIIAIIFLIYQVGSL